MDQLGIASPLPKTFLFLLLLHSIRRHQAFDQVKEIRASKAKARLTLGYILSLILARDFFLPSLLSPSPFP